MPVGPGKYDGIATAVWEVTKARAVLVAVVDGNKGSGFSMQTSDQTFAFWIPAILRNIADGIEADMKSTRS